MTSKNRWSAFHVLGVSSKCWSIIICIETILICCIAQGTQPNILWWSIWEKNRKKNGCVYMYNWITLLYSRIDHNIVITIWFTNQLYFNKTFIFLNDFYFFPIIAGLSCSVNFLLYRRWPSHIYMHIFLFLTLSCSIISD